MRTSPVFKSWLMGTCAMALAQAVLATGAQAQDFTKEPAKEPTAIETPWAEQIQDAINFGPFKFNAGVTASEVYSDNIFVTRNNKQQDTYTVFAPYINANVDVGEHTLKLRSGAEIGRFNRFTSENYEDFYIGADGRYRFGANTSLIGGAEYRWEHEPRESPDAIGNAAEPTKYRYGDYYAGIVHRSENVIGRLGATMTTYDFDDTSVSGGGTINNQNRDRKQYEVGSRVGYRFSPAYEAFVQGYWDGRYYDQSAANRDSKGYRAAVGVRGNAGPSLQGEAYVGILYQSYDNAAYGDVNTMDVGASLTWIPAASTSLRAYLDRSLEETTLVGASGYVRSALGASVSHALRPDMSINGHLQYSRNEYQGVRRTDYLIDSGLGLKYFFMPNLFIGPEYRLLRRQSDVPGAEFTENRVMIRLGAQLAPGYEGNPDSFSPFTSEYGPGSFYVGLQTGTGVLASGLFGPRGPGTNTADFGADGWQGGAFVGYGLTVDRVYFGIEGDFEGSNTEWAHNGTPGSNRVFSIRKKDSYEIAARIGYVLENQALLYGRFGAVRTRFETPYLDDSLNFVQGNDRRTGMRYGGGTDVPLYGNFFGRMEYTFTSYPDYNVQPAGQPDNFANTENLMRFGFGFRFNRGPGEDKPLPKAKYDGFYAGASVGHGALMGANSGLRSGNPIDFDRAGFGATAGVFGGYGLTVMDAVYLGAEVEAESSDVNWRIERDPSGRQYSVAKDYSYGASLRAGYIVRGNTLLYGRVGVVRARFTNDFATSGAYTHTKETKTGLRYGGGVEMPVGNGMKMRLDYTVTDYPGYDVSYGANTDHFENTENLFRVGLSYRF